MDMLDRMLGHDHWATTRILDLSQDLTDAQLDQEFDIGHRTLRETLDHMIFVINAWTGLMAGEPTSMKRDGQRRSIAELQERHERYQRSFAAFARKAQDEQILDETFIDHYDYPQSIGATILQVLHHNAQHRGEARHILDRLSVSDLPDFDPQEWEHMTGRIEHANR